MLDLPDQSLLPFNEAVADRLSPDLDDLRALQPAEMNEAEMMSEENKGGFVRR